MPQYKLNTALSLFEVIPIPPLLSLFVNEYEDYHWNSLRGWAAKKMDFEYLNKKDNSLDVSWKAEMEEVINIFWKGN